MIHVVPETENMTSEHKKAHIKLPDEQEASDNSSQFKKVMITFILLLLVKAGKTSSLTWTNG